MAEKPLPDAAVPFYETDADIYLALKCSKDRGSRKEDSDVLQGMYEDFKQFNSGFRLQPLRDELESQKKGK